MSYTIPGKNKGDPRVSIEDAEDKDLNYWANRMQKDLDGDPNGPYAQKNRDTLAAIAEELERRGMGDGPPPSDRANVAPAPRTEVVRQPPRTALATRESAGILKTPEQAFAKMKELSEVCHMVNAPAAGCAIPDGCGIAWTMTFIDVARDTYPIPGGTKRGIGKEGLNKISMGMGVTWDPERSKRLDDGRHPHYCRYLAVGKLRDADGTWIDIFDEKELDLRDGSAYVMSGGSKNGPMSEQQLAQQRSNILSLAITKARNRAIRGRGVACAYEPKDLEKPFVSFRLMFTGDSTDPEIRRMKAKAMLDGDRALFGSLREPVGQLVGHAAPPIGSTSTDYDQETGEIY